MARLRWHIDAIAVHRLAAAASKIALFIDQWNRTARPAHLPGVDLLRRIDALIHEVQELDLVRLRAII
jgi:hypothetical protein